VPERRYSAADGAEHPEDLIDLALDGERIVIVAENGFEAMLAPVHSSEPIAPV
jgi:hypothetical protein